MGRLAAIDVGSTSVHVLVAEVLDGRVIPEAELSEFAGLGEAVAAHGRLGDARAADLAELLARCSRWTVDLGASDVVAVATAPLRRAADAARVVGRVEADGGLPLHVLEEREEALLTLLGAMRGRSLPGGVALVDVGGGSTEVVTGRPDGAPSVIALPLGAATLAGRHVTADPPAPGELVAMRAEARSAVAAMPRIAMPTALAVGGTADNLARIAGASRLTPDVIESVLARLGELTTEEASAAFGVRVARARLLPAGAAILLAVLERSGLGAVEVSGAGLREGALLAVATAGRGWRDRLPAMVAASLRGDDAG